MAHAIFSLIGRMKRNLRALSADREKGPGTIAK
jgi:hypothetical protein